MSSREAHFLFSFREQNFSASLPSFPSPLTSVNTWLTTASQLNPSDWSYFYGNVFNYQTHRGRNVKTAYPGFISSQASIWLDLGAFVPCSTFPVSVWMTLTGSSLIWLFSSMSCRISKHKSRFSVTSCVRLGLTEWVYQRDIHTLIHSYSAFIFVAIYLPLHQALWLPFLQHHQFPSEG